MLWLDDYERRARLIPGLVLVAPVPLLVVMFGLRENPVIVAVIGALSTFGAPVVLANFVRHQGLEIQERMWKRWGGSPTVSVLQTAQPARRKSWRAAIEKVTGATLPPDGSQGRDDEFDAPLAVLRSKTRDRTRFSLLFEENRNYGYERNLLGLRRIGLFIALACVAGAAFVVAALFIADQPLRAEYLIGLFALIAVVGVWLWLPSERRTRTTANKYAEQLLDAAVDLATP